MKESVEIGRRIYNEDFFEESLFLDSYCFSLRSVGKSLREDLLENLVCKSCIWSPGSIAWHPAHALGIIT